MLYMWTIYDHPRDYPICFVARKWEIGPHGATMPTDHICFGATLEEVRSLLPKGLICIRRDPVKDDPNIVETWL